MQNSNETWKWGDGTEVPISEMSLFSCLKAALHCMKRIRHYSDQTRYFEYKLEVAKTEKAEQKAKASIKKCTDIKLLFGTKLDAIGERCKKIGTPLPTDFEEIKQLLEQRFPETQQAEEDPIREKAEAENEKEEVASDFI